MSEIVVTVKLPEGVEAEDVEVTVDPMPAKVEESGPHPEWRPIETAPRGQRSAMLISDGRQVLIGGRAWICTGEQHPTNFWHTQDGSGWNPAFTFKPTHWMPLPAPAEARSEQAEGEA